jgi:hypothetical protein
MAALFIAGFGSGSQNVNQTDELNELNELNELLVGLSFCLLFDGLCVDISREK